MKLVVGLGNPGMKYAVTRHNVGFFVIDHLSDAWRVPMKWHRKTDADIGEGHVNGEKVILCKPQTYMNLSGAAVRAIIDYFSLGLDNVVIVYDDLDLPPGQIRLRLKGGAGGHNGMRSIIQQLGTDQFKRIRIGIGRPMPPLTVTDHVLAPFQKSEEEEVAQALDRSIASINCWLETTFAEAMNRYNVKQ